jgi:DNA-binding transcriptional LysR family regulator
MCIALERKIAGRDFALRGDIRVTAPHGLATGFLAQYLPDFIARYPGIRVDIDASDSELDLGRREADIALRATSAPPEHLVGRACRVAVLVGLWLDQLPRAHGLSVRHGRSGRAPRDRRDQQNFQRLPVFAWLAKHVPDDAIVARAADLETMAALAREGVGLALLPSDQHLPDLHRLFPVEPRFTGELWLLTHPDLRHVARIKTFMEFLTERLRNDPAPLGTGPRA